MLIYSHTYLRAPLRRFLLEKLTGSQLDKKFPAVYGTQSSLLHSQIPATCPYLEPDQSSPCPPVPLPEDPSYYYLPIYAWVFQVVSFVQVSPPKPCIHLSSPATRATQPAHLIILDFMTRIFGDEYRSFISSLYSIFLHPCYSIPLRILISKQVIYYIFIYNRCPHSVNGDPWWSARAGQGESETWPGGCEIMCRVSSHYETFPTIEQRFFPSWDFVSFILMTARKNHSF